jgi:hypothetical protein
VHLIDANGRFMLGASGALLIMLCLVVGCGSSSQPQAMKPAAFRGQANAVCQKANRARKEATEEQADANGGKSTDEEAQEFMNSLLMPVKQMTDEIGKLGAPKGDTKRVEEIISAYEPGVEQLETDPSSPKAQFAFSKASRLATDYGLTSCTI